MRTLLLVLTLALTAQAAGPVGDKHVYKTVDGRELSLYVVSPETNGKPQMAPAVVFYHGGGWTGGQPTQFNDWATHLASRGMVAIQVQYRLLDKSTKDPPTICVEDAKSAMRWVRSHAQELGIDPNRIAAGGGSAGGHLAAFVGMVEGHDADGDDKNVSAKANALLLFNPVFDNGPDGGWGTARVGDRYPEFSPAHNISADDPPAIIFLGTSDKLIDVAVGERFRDGMKKVGVRCELQLFEDQPHGF
ncbi:MAG: alpha/beta hydrolase, partial [Planctomycetaceae bacterium]|nr:alpha/beta hydrolase [Planctomycetaceae bacterium]